ncbi:hypothetical protein L6452_27456 [Arctium lappa]|uniref:Uncharacterized protein n=1 Tax=Arctium lappa TaxID=4217 RepID=A0ACB8ZW40_ARCLA|nr:hypothetical protein L6452_27456 [Arctium lappa]
MEIAPELTSKTKVATPRSGVKRMRMDSSKEPSFSASSQSSAANLRKMKIDKVTNVSGDEVVMEIAPELTSKTKVATPRSGVKRMRMDSSKEPSFSASSQSSAANPRKMKM